MRKARFFQSGDSHPVRPMEHAFHLLANLPADFLSEGRQDDLPQKREDDGTWQK